MAVDVPKIIEPPTPCSALDAISHSPDCDEVQRIAAIASMTIPIWNIPFLPRMSERRPKGRRNVAAARRYAVATQLRDTASRENLDAMAGSAMVIDEDVKGAR